MRENETTDEQQHDDSGAFDFGDRALSCESDPEDRDHPDQAQGGEDK